MDEFEELREDFNQREQRRLRRVLQRKWDAMKDISHTINCAFLGPVVKGEEVDVEVQIGDEVLRHVVGRKVRVEAGGDLILEPDVKRLGYKGAVEKWATWKWHTLRGTPVDERDNYHLEPDFLAPKFVWEVTPTTEASAEEAPKKRGRPKKTEATA